MEQELIIRTSDKASFKRCRQSWDWSSRIRSNLKSVGIIKPLEFGIAWHEGMAIWYEPELWDKDRKMVLDLALAKMFEVMDEQQERADMKDDPEVIFDYMERKILAQGMLAGYATWSVGKDTFTPVFVEKKFQIPVIDPSTGEQYFIDGNPVFYEGRLDGLVKDIYGRYWILEHKTAKQAGSIEHLDLDPQCGAYLWAMSQVGIHCAGVIYTQAFKNIPTDPVALKATRSGRNYSVANKSLPRDMAMQFLKDKGENPAAYEDWLLQLPTESPFFRRIEVYRTQASIKNTGITIFHEAVDMLNDPAIYPNPGWNTCNYCSFRSPCIAKQDGLDYQFMLDELYVPNKWVD